MLQQWNERMALVSRASIDRSFSIHYADSLWIAHTAREYVENNTVWDLGSGAGFPGIIFAIRYPDIHVTLFEKLLKKQTFLSACVAQLELKNVTVEGAMPKMKMPGLCLARAVHPPPELFKFAEKTLAPESHLAVNLGSQASFEAPNRFTPLLETQYVLPDGQGPRKIGIYRLVPRETKIG